MGVEPMTSAIPVQCSTYYRNFVFSPTRLTSKGVGKQITCGQRFEFVVIRNPPLGCVSACKFAFFISVLTGNSPLRTLTGLLNRQSTDK